MSQNISRRTVLRAFASIGLLGISGLAGCSFGSTQAEKDFNEPGLGDLAGNEGRFYGAAIQSSQLNDESFARALLREVNLLVPETELKWNALRPSSDAFDFRGYHRIAEFARDNYMNLRGHTLIWHHANPSWLGAALATARPAAAEKIMRAHIERVVAETKDTVRNWDVVNEGIDPQSHRADGLRETPWLKALGPEYIALAFHMAHDADSDLTLVYNDYGLEYDDSYARAKRHALLEFLLKCRKERVPIQALGLQSHLQCHRPLGGTQFATFLKEVHALGYATYITELDVDISHLPGRVDEACVIAQNYVSAYLDLVTKTAPVDTLLTWGLSDRYTWLKQVNPNGAGALPLTAKLNRSPMWQTLKAGWVDV